MKKHITQMTSSEVKYLTKRFKSVRRSEWKFNPYSKKRAITRGIDMAVLNSLWYEGFELIEYHKHEDGSDRILLRSVTTDRKDRQVCVVFNFNKKEITTTYLNERANKHFKLDWNEYDSSLNVLELAHKRSVV